MKITTELRQVINQKFPAWSGRLSDKEAAAALVTADKKHPDIRTLMQKAKFASAELKSAEKQLGKFGISFDPYDGQFGVRDATKLSAFVSIPKPLPSARMVMGTIAAFPKDRAIKFLSEHGIDWS